VRETHGSIKGPNMSEEERKEKQELSIVSILALGAGIATFLCSLLILPLFIWSAIVESPGALGAYGITIFLMVLAFFSFILLLPSVAIGLPLSIITLLIERDMRFRLLPLAFVLAGILALYYILCL